MCGIAGFCSFEQNYKERKKDWETILISMNRCLSHRGPDENGIFLGEHFGFSHARLSIQDMVGGTQPMLRKKSDTAPFYAITYNGEIYNGKELRPALERNGCRFSTTSDTEIILYAYMNYGPSFVSRLNGIFSFAIWDEQKQTLLLYRDRAGVKPLFYTLKENTLLFASEPKGLFVHPLCTPTIDRESLQELFAIGPAHTSGHGIFHGVYEVLPGHYMKFQRKGFSDIKYWDLTSRPHTDSYPETVAHVSWLVRDSITRQMISDVPVCTFLSGGIDSSIVTSVAASYLCAQGETLNTFSFDFTGNDIYFQSNSFQPERDLPYVNQMLNFCPTNHTYLECNQQQLFDSLSTAVVARDMPGMTDVDSSLLYFCSQVAKHNKVALTGECADEIFGGYPWFYREELIKPEGFPWSLDMNARKIFLCEDVLCDLKLEDYAQMRYENSVKQVPTLEEDTPMEGKRRQISYLNIKWFMQALLDRMDRTSMHSGLEARVPFADHRIMEYLFNVPWSMKFQHGQEKYLLRDACKDLLPPELLHRKKSPYPKTYHPAYEQLLIARLTKIVNDSNAPIQPFIDKNKVLAFMKCPSEYGKPWFGQLMAGPQLMAYYIQLNEWMQLYHLHL